MSRIHKLELGSLPVELLYAVQLLALSDTLPHVSWHFYRLYKYAPPSFHAEYILGRLLIAGNYRDFGTKALCYPLCTTEVLDALCRHPSCPSLQKDAPDIPQRLFRHLSLTAGASEWTEDDHPIPFLKHLYNHPSIHAPNIIAHKCYAFTQAVGAEFLPLICFLLDHCDEQHIYEYAQDTLWGAAVHGYESVVELLLARDDINVNLKLQYGYTPLSIAARIGHESVVNLLLARDDINVNQKADRGDTSLSLAIDERHESVVELLLARDDINVNLKAKYGGDTPLSIAASRGCESVVKLLLARDDINVNLKADCGDTPLLFAVRGRYESVVKLLLERDNIDVNTKNSDGMTPLLFAVSRGQESVVKLLLEQDNIDVNAKNSDGITPLSIAASRGHESMVKLLLEQDDVDMNLGDCNGGTPLSYAIEKGCRSAVKLLLAHASSTPKLCHSDS